MITINQRGLKIKSIKKLSKPELIGGDVDKKGKKVKAHLKHFSRYAVAWSN